MDFSQLPLVVNEQDAVFIGSDCIDSFLDALSAHWLLSKCSLSVLWVLSECTLMLFESSLSAFWVLSECSLSAPWVLSNCSLSALWVLSECSLSALRVLSEYLLTADIFLTNCLNIWARMMKIDCSRQVWHKKGVAISEKGVAISFWCGYFILVWLFTKMVWLFHLAFLGLLSEPKNG